MRRIALLLFLPVCLSLCSGTALANSVVTMHFIGTDGNQGGGYYTYPYYFSVSGSASMALICDSYDREITPGETWQAMQYTNFLNGIQHGLFAGQPNATLDYKAAGLIFEAITTGSVNAVGGNYAIWGFFSQNALNNPEYQSSGAGAIAANYLALAGTDPNSAYRGLSIYVPLAGSKGMAAQEFFSYTPMVAPEPATMTLLGTGLLSLFGAARRKLRKA